MPTDIIIPQTNIEKFIQIAKNLSYKNLIMVGEKDFSEEIKFLSKMEEKNPITLSVVQPQTIMQATQDLRRILEGGKTKLIYAQETIEKKDKHHYRNSGLNHILCQIAHDNKITIGFSFSLILKTSGIKRAVILGRMKQNVKLCRKFKVKMFLGSFATSPYEMRSPHDLESFGCLIGMHPKEAKESLNLTIKH